MTSLLDEYSGVAKKVVSPGPDLMSLPRRCPLARSGRTTCRYCGLPGSPVTSMVDVAVVNCHSDEVIAARYGSRNSENVPAGLIGSFPTSTMAPFRAAMLFFRKSGTFLLRFSIPTILAAEIVDFGWNTRPAAPRFSLRCKASPPCSSASRCTVGDPAADRLVSADRLTCLAASRPATEALPDDRCRPTTDAALIIRREVTIDASAPPSPWLGSTTCSGSGCRSAR